MTDHILTPSPLASDVTEETGCVLCGKPYERCGECGGDGKGRVLQGDYGECPMCSGDGDTHECSGSRSEKGTEDE